MMNGKGKGFTMNCKCQQPTQGVPPNSGQMYTPNSMMQHHPNQVMGAQHTGINQPPMAQPQYGAMDYNGTNYQTMPQGYPYQNQMVGGYQQQPQYMNMNPHQPAQMGYPQTGQPQVGYPHPGQGQVGNHQIDWQGMPQYGLPNGADQPSQPMMPMNQAPNATNYPNGYPGTMPQQGYIPEEHDDDFD